MIHFFQTPENQVIALGSHTTVSSKNIEKIYWLFSGAQPSPVTQIVGPYIGPRREMITPWSSNVVDIISTAGIEGVYRVELFYKKEENSDFDPMLQQQYEQLDEKIFEQYKSKDPVKEIADIAQYNEQEGLALNELEIAYLDQLTKTLKRKLTDSEIFGFSQINSEHCRHKIFNGTFIIDGITKPYSLFDLIKATSKKNPNLLVSAYKDNVALIEGPLIEQFSPKNQNKADWFQASDFQSVLSLKAETHNFPTTVEPFNGAATGSGGEIRDRLAGGCGSLPLAGTAVYMTSYPRLNGQKDWEKEARKWSYHDPASILIKASNGASDFGNKFGQPLICGSLLTFEHTEGEKRYGYDKVVMLAGGIGYGKKKDAIKQKVLPNQNIVVLGGDNYRIGMGGGAVSSVDTGAFHENVELSAVQRSNPEMQKRVANTIRAMVEKEDNPIISIHDHGAGGHLNCLSELMEDSGGVINMDKLPIGDNTLSSKELLSNESQERMGLVIEEKDNKYLQEVAKRERTPYYEVGKSGNDKQLIFKEKGNQTPFNINTNQLFESFPSVTLHDTSIPSSFGSLVYRSEFLKEYIKNTLQLESVACKDWLTNKVDRCVTGKVATQQTCGELQLPLNNVAVMALDFSSKKGVATSIGHAPIAGLIDAGAGSRVSITKALTNLVWASLTHELGGISLSANWMWPAKNKGENTRLYEGVKAISEFAIELGINIPTGKDSMSMTQRYKDGNVVLSPGTVIVSSIAEVDNINNTISPVLDYGIPDTVLVYIDFSAKGFELGGSALAQTLSQIGDKSIDVDARQVIKSFILIQQLIKKRQIIAGHDVSSGGLITTLLEMCFANIKGGIEIDLSVFDENDIIKILFSEKPAAVIQINEEEAEALCRHDKGNSHFIIGRLHQERQLLINASGDAKAISLNIDELRNIWFKTSAILDSKQTINELSKNRTNHKFEQPLIYQLSDINTTLFRVRNHHNKTGHKAGIIREQGVNSDREMAYGLWKSGFDVKDIHMTDLISGEEDLSDLNMIVFVGGFSYSDVLGSAKGWAGAFKYNKKAKESLENFYQRNDTLSFGVCNGCQLMMELELIHPLSSAHPKVTHNSSGKFECSFVNVDINQTEAIMLKPLEKTRLGVWLAHGEGRFVSNSPIEQSNIAMQYSYDKFPGNANGSVQSVAALVSSNGRHLAMMPHLERSLFSWNWPYKKELPDSEFSPWMLPFIAALDWVKKITKEKTTAHE